MTDKNAKSDSQTPAALPLRDSFPGIDVTLREPGGDICRDQNRIEANAAHLRANLRSKRTAD